MNDNSMTAQAYQVEQAAAVPVVLTRDELLFVLTQLGVGEMAGLDEDPLGDVPPPVQERILAVAARGLHARGYAQPNGSGWTLDDTVTSAVATCAQAQKSIFVYYWQAGADVPTRTFSHVRDGQAVLHTYPAPALHQFTFYPNYYVDALAAELVTACGGVSETTGPGPTYRLPSARFAEARGLASGGDPAAAAKLLAETGLPGGVAAALLAAVTGAAPVAILQIAVQVDGQTQQVDCTLVQGQGPADNSWLIEVAPDHGETLTLRPVAQTDFVALLKSHL